MTKQIKFGITALLLLIVLVAFNPFSINDAGERQVVQTLGGDLNVRFEPGLYFAGFFSKVTTYPNNVTIQVGTEENRSKDADYWSMSNIGTFAEGDQAKMGHTTKWDMPSTAKEMIDLHTTYNNMDNLANTTLMQYQRETASYSCQRMTSEAHYSGGQSQLKDFFQDQLRKGQVLLITSTKTETLTDGTSKTYIEVKEKLDSEGNMIRTTGDVQRYNLKPSFVSIDFIEYDDRIYKKLKEKIDAAADEATSKQRLITAQQEKETAVVEGEKLIAEVTAKEEAQEQQEVIQARKAKLVAAENLEQAKLDAAALLATKRAEAAGDKLKVIAGLSPREKAEWNYKTRVGVAEALAKRAVPTFVMGGSSNSGSGLSEAYTMEKMLLLQKELNKSNK